MNNKQYLITMLENLVGNWDMAQSLLTVIQTVDINEKTIDAISKVMKEAIHSMESKEDAGKMAAGLDIIEKIKSIEKKSKEEEKGEIEELEKMIDDM